MALRRSAWKGSFIGKDPSLEGIVHWNFKLESLSRSHTVRTVAQWAVAASVTGYLINQWL